MKITTIALFSITLTLIPSSPAHAIHTTFTGGSDGDKQIPIGLIALLIGVIVLVVVLLVRRRRKK